MHPILIRIGPMYVYSYGLMVAIGFAVATMLMYKHPGEYGIDKDKIIDFGIMSLIGGIIGGRILYIALNIRYYIANPLEVFNLTKGGLVWYGAFISGLIIAAWFVKKNKIDFWNAADLYAPYIALAQSFGRIGCFLNGCCYGLEAHRDSFPGVTFPNESILRYPTQFYSSLALLLIFIILRKWQAARHFKGEIFLGYIALYSIKRFGIEFLRGDNPRIFAGLTISQLISIVMCIVALTYGYTKWKKSLKSA